ADASAVFGRFILSQIMSAIFERVAVKKEDRSLTYVIVDEAHEYFRGDDQTLSTLLEQARKFGIGIMVSHQMLDHFSQKTRAAILTNTTIKIAGGISDVDARTLDAEMRTTTDFLMSTKKHEKSTEFACYIANK